MRKLHGRKLEPIRGWLMRLKGRNFHNRKVCGEADNAEDGVTASYPEASAELMDEGSSPAPRIGSID